MIQFLNTSLNLLHAKDNFLIDNRVRVENFLDEEYAAKLYETLSTQTIYNLALTIDRQPGELSSSKLNELSNEKKKDVFNNIYKDAAQGIGFLYDRHLISEDNKSDKLLVELFDLINSDEFIDTIKYITGEESIKTASAQATRYRQGCFLTRHNDINLSEERRIAYVLGLTPEWHPDWGGLLQFYEQNGKPRDSWPPNFNSLTLFDVSHVHAVTFVTPFAPKSRYSITGWFRAN